MRAKVFPAREVVTVFEIVSAAWLRPVNVNFTAVEETAKNGAAAAFVATTEQVAEVLAVTDPVVAIMEQLGLEVA